MNGQILFHTQYLVLRKTPEQIEREDPELGKVWREVRGTLGQTHYGRPVAFHQQAHHTNWLHAFSRIEAPALILYGEFDWFEELDDHLAIQRAINRNAPGRAKVVVVPKMDHHFSVYPSLQDAFDRKNQTIDPEPALKIILTWLKQTFP